MNAVYDLVDKVRSNAFVHPKGIDRGKESATDRPFGPRRTACLLCRGLSEGHACVVEPMLVNR